MSAFDPLQTFASSSTGEIVRISFSSVSVPSKLLVAGLLVALAAAAFGAPPPPARPPSGLDQPIDGYDMRTPYQLWRYWVEKQKGPVTEALLEQPQVIEGLKPLGLLLRFTKHNDFGHFLTGEIRGHCRTVAPNQYSPIPGSCRYLLRRAYVPLDAESYGEPNPVSEWTRKNFDARRLARHFRKIGLGPDTDWWMADRDKMFSLAPSPRTILTENAVVVRLDSNECPQMARAIEALEGKPIGVKVDLATVGKDDEELPLRPHAVISTYKLYLRGGGSRFFLEGSGGHIAEMVNPILDAADACEKARPG